MSIFLFPPIKLVKYLLSRPLARPVDFKEIFTPFIVLLILGLTIFLTPQNILAQKFLDLKPDVSNPVPGDDSRGAGPNITAGWAIAGPTIDGTINPAEWSTAYVIDINILPGGNPVMLYIMNDADYLYLAFDDGNDVSLENLDGPFIGFDDEGGLTPILYDNIWTSLSCPATEGVYYGEVGTGSERFYLSMSQPVGCYPGVEAVNMSFAYTFNGANMQYEFAIALNVSHLQAVPGETFGMGFGSWDGGSGTMTGAFPSVYNPLDPPTFANLSLAAPTIPTVSEWGLIVMSLLLLCAGLILLRRRQAQALAAGRIS